MMWFDPKDERALFVDKRCESFKVDRRSDDLFHVAPDMLCDFTDLTKHGFSWRARKHLKPKCEACGHPYRLQAHHINQDIRDNRPENIQTLCKHCHDFWHTTAKRRGKTVAGRMPCLA